MLGYSTALSRLYDKISEDTAKKIRGGDMFLNQKDLAVLTSSYATDLLALIYFGMRQERTESDKAQNNILSAIIGRDISTIPSLDDMSFPTRSSINGASLQQGVNRIAQNLSDEVNYSVQTLQLKKEEPTATRINEYLHNTEKLKDDFRLVADGEALVASSLHQSLVLSRTEINMAYRTAEQARWRNLDFILGYEIKQSSKHPIYDICDELAGIYPKSFVWVGWHPNCMCYAVPIVATEEENWDKSSIGSTMSDKSVKDMPKNFVEWIRTNEQRIEAAYDKGKLPYFIRDNESTIRNIRENLKNKSTLEES